MAIDARAEAPPPIVPGTVARDLDDMDRFGTETAIADRIRVRLLDDRGRGHEVGGCYAYARKCLER